MTTKTKFTLVMVLASLLGAVSFGLLSFLESRQSLRAAAFDELTAIRTTRVAQVEEYFESVFDEANVITENPLVSDAMRAFRAGFDALETEAEAIAVGNSDELRTYYESEVIPQYSKLIDKGTASWAGFAPKSIAGKYLQTLYMARNPGARSQTENTAGDTLYEKAHATFHKELRFIRDQLGYYDMFLIDHRTGNIVYDVEKEADFATNIYNGPYRGSRLGEVIDLARDDPAQQAIHMSDFEFYLPSNNTPAVFVASPIYDNDELIGILAIQLTISDLESIMTADRNWEASGLKTSGETYMIGADKLLRSGSRFQIEAPEAYYDVLSANGYPVDVIERMKARNTSVLLQNVDTDASRAALAGRTDARVINDYRGVEVLSAYAPLRVGGLNYAIIAEIDAAEAFKPVTTLLTRTAITTGIVLPLSALLGWIIAMRLMRPAQEMQATTQRFIDGDETVSFQDEGSDEWGQLGSSLNQLLATARNRLSLAEKSREEVRTNIGRLMPNAIGERFLEGESELVSAEDMASAAVIFILPDDKFHNVERAQDIQRLYETLDDRLDEAATREGVDMLNQAGLHYVAFCGLTAPMKNHAERVFRYLIIAERIVRDFNAEFDCDLKLKMGMETGPMFGALIGNYSTAYEIWGPAVLRAKAMSHATAIGGLTLSRTAVDQVGKKIKGTTVDVTTLTGEALKATHVAAFPTPGLHKSFGV